MTSDNGRLAMSNEMDLSVELSAPADRWNKRVTTIGRRLLAINVYLERFNTLHLTCG